MESHELIVAKINAAVKIVEWAKDDIEPGIGGNPPQLHVALAEAFKVVYQTVSDAVAADQAKLEPAKPEPKPAG